jgi:hypothetical protein
MPISSSNPPRTKSIHRERVTSIAATKPGVGIGRPVIWHHLAVAQS